MNAKRLTALLLAVLMVFALSACAGSGAGAGGPKEADVKAAADGKAASYDALLAAVEQVYNDPDATAEDAMKAAFGADFAALMMDFYAAAQEMGEVDDADFADVNFLNLEDYEKGSEVKLEVKEATALTEEQVKEIQEQADGVAQSMEMVSQFYSMYDNMSDEELEESGMTQEDLAQMKVYIDKMVKLGEYFQDCTVGEGTALKLNVTVNGEAQELEKTVVKIGDSWVFSDLIDFMS